jgi:hypothetical protein
MVRAMTFLTRFLFGIPAEPQPNPCLYGPCCLEPVTIDCPECGADADCDHTGRWTCRGKIFRHSGFIDWPSPFRTDLCTLCSQEKLGAACSVSSVQRVHP